MLDFHHLFWRIALQFGPPQSSQIKSVTFIALNILATIWGPIAVWIWRNAVYIRLIYAFSIFVHKPPASARRVTEYWLSAVGFITFSILHPLKQAEVWRRESANGQGWTDRFVRKFRAAVAQSGDLLPFPPVIWIAPNNTKSPHISLRCDNVPLSFVTTRSQISNSCRVFSRAINVWGRALGGMSLITLVINWRRASLSAVFSLH